MDAGNRFLKLFANIFGSAAARVINFLVAMLLVPLTISSLSSEDYAFFSVTVSISAFTAYADFGLGLTVVNAIAKAIGDSKMRKAVTSVTTVWISLLFIACGGLLLICVVWLVCQLFSIQLDDQVFAAGLGLICVFIGLPTGLVSRVLFARQRNISANVWATIGKIASLVCVWYSVENGFGTLFVLIVCVLGVPVTVGWVSTAYVFWFSDLRVLKPRVGSFDLRLIPLSFARGKRFLVLQVAPYVETGIDVILIGYFVSMDVVPAYDVYSKLYLYIAAVTSLMVMPIWPSISNARASGDAAWADILIRRSVKMVSAAAILIAGGVFFLSGTLVLKWTGVALMMGNGVELGMALFSVIACISMTQSTILNSLAVVEAQVRILKYYLPVLIIAKVFAVAMFGVEAMLWSMCFLGLGRLLFLQQLIRTARLSVK